MLKREWGAESNGKLPHLFIPSKTAILVPKFAVKDLPLDSTLWWWHTVCQINNTIKIIDKHFVFSLHVSFRVQKIKLMKLAHIFTKLITQKCFVFSLFNKENIVKHRPIYGLNCELILGRFEYNNNNNNNHNPNNHNNHHHNHHNHNHNRHHHQSILAKGRSFTANLGTKVAVLLKGRSSTANSGTQTAVLLGMDSCASFPLLSAPHSLFSIWTDVKRSEKIPRAAAWRWGEWIWLIGSSRLYRNSPQGLNISSIRVFDQTRDPEITINLRPPSISFLNCHCIILPSLFSFTLWLIPIEYLR